MSEIKSGALVYYKSKPAVVTAVSDKIDILFFKTTKRVRDKDIIVLHPGPLKTADELSLEVPAPPESLDETIELLEGETVALTDLADYLYGESTPQTAWSAWLLVVDGLYFEGNVDAIKPRDPELIQQEKQQREAKQAQKDAWDAFIARIESGKILPEDHTQLSEVEQLACGERENSRILKTIGIQESKEDAHKLLLKLGYWAKEYNPWPRRMTVNMSNPELAVPDAVETERKDLRELQAWAIDDVGNQDPDDAISLQDGRLWVHIADASSIIQPDSEVDIEARSRGTNLYLPDQVIHMLPRGITEKLGLGLQQESPALTISFIIDDNGDLQDIDVCFSLLKVTRTTYESADEELETTFADIKAVTERYQKRRMDNNAAMLDLPEVNIKVVDGEILIQPYSNGGSRQIVAEAMLAAGEAVAIYAEQHNIPIPYAYQPEPEEIQHPEKLSEHYAYRRYFKPSRHATVADSHFGLGLAKYTRVTSPLRRYLDLVVHQQLRAYLNGQDLLGHEAVVERIGLADESSFASRKAERFSNQHWKMLYLKRNKDWQGEAVVVLVEEHKTMVIIPELALETKIRSKTQLKLDQVIKVQVQSVYIPDLQATFRILKS